MPVHDWNGVNAGVFHDFHHEWISKIRNTLNDRLPEDYYALAEQITGPFGPDVVTLQRPSHRSEKPGGVALLDRPPQTKVRERAETERYARKRKRVTVRHSSDHTVIAVVEVVSPGNKDSRSSFDQFLRKAWELIDGGIHLAVLDLNPPTPRDPDGVHAAIWNEYSSVPYSLPPETPLTFAAYCAGIDPEAFVSPIAVGESLPELPIFLSADFYIPLELEPTYMEAWAAVPKYWKDEISKRAAL